MDFEIDIPTKSELNSLIRHGYLNHGFSGTVFTYQKSGGYIKYIPYYNHRGSFSYLKEEMQNSKRKYSFVKDITKEEENYCGFLLIIRCDKEKIQKLLDSNKDKIVKFGNYPYKLVSRLEYEEVELDENDNPIVRGLII